MKLTKSQQIILKYLAAQSGENLYESQISQNTRLSAGSANQSLKALFKQGMVNLAKKGNMNFYSLNLDNPLVRQFKVTQLISELNGLIDGLKTLTDRIILFGSCAEGIDIRDSDIDLAIVSSQADKVRNLIKGAKTEKEIQPLIFGLREFAALETKDKPLYERIQKGIVLWMRQ